MSPSVNDHLISIILQVYSLLQTKDVYVMLHSTNISLFTCNLYLFLVYMNHDGRDIAKLCHGKTSDLPSDTSINHAYM